MDRDTFLSMFKSAPELPERYRTIALGFSEQYLKILEEQKIDETPYIGFLKVWFQEIFKQLQAPYEFPCYHKKCTDPINYYQLGNDVLTPLIDFDHSHILGEELIPSLLEKLKAKENVVLLSNHQIEADPQVISILLDKKFPDFAPNIISVAGERVVTDPFAIPFSLGRNLLCIYSKKYIDHPPEKSLEKREHNQKAMNTLLELFKEGGHCFWVAPSGGRDRPNADGEFELSPFDPKSIEMFRLLARKAPNPTHFYPLSLLTYEILPPPDTVQKELGEQRNTSRGAVGFALSKALDFQELESSIEEKGPKKREAVAQKIWDIVNTQYQKLLHLSGK